LEYEYVKACGDEYLFKYLIELVGRYSTVNFQRLIDEASDKKVEMYGGKSSDSYYTRFATVTASLIRRIPGNKLPKEYIPHAAFRRMFPRA
jgi:hypothetical protein